MTNSEEFAAEIIHDLLHIDLDIRKKGFKKIKENWDIKFREYLWTGIESEKNKKLQADMVYFALHKLESDSLRKMLRFIEQDKLHTRAKNHVLNTYLGYEDDLVREALIKSLKRKGQTYRFVCELFNEPFPAHYSVTNYTQFISDILNPEIDNIYRKEIVIQLMNWYFYNFQTDLISEFIWDFIYNDKYLTHIVLQSFYKQNHKLDLNFSKVKRPLKLIWETWNWNIIYNNTGLDLPFENHFLELLTEKELFLLRCCEAEENQIKSDLVEILPKLMVNEPPKNYDKTYTSALYKVWDQIVDKNWEVILYQLANFEKSVLDQVFDIPIFGDESSPLLSEFLAIEGVHPLDLVGRIIAYLPRFYLTKIIKNSNDTILISAIKALSNKKFFIFPSNNQLLGPPSYWKNLFHFIFTLFQDSSRKKVVYGEVTELLFLLIEILTNHSNNFIAGELKDHLISNFSDYSSTIGDQYTVPIIYRINQFLNLNEIIISKDDTMTSKQQIIMFQYLFDTAILEVNSKSLSNIILMNNYRVQSFILDFLNDQLENNNNLDVSVHKEVLFYLTNTLKLSSDVRIRTKSSLLQSKLKEY